MIEIDKAEAAFAGDGETGGILRGLTGLEDCLITPATTEAEYTLPSVVAQGLHAKEVVFGERVFVVTLNLEIATSIDEEEASEVHRERVSAVREKLDEPDLSDQIDEEVEGFFCWSAAWREGGRMAAERALIDVFTLELTCALLV